MLLSRWWHSCISQVQGLNILYISIRAQPKGRSTCLFRYYAGMQSIVALPQCNRQRILVLNGAVRTDFTQIPRITGPRLRAPGKSPVVTVSNSGTQEAP